VTLWVWAIGIYGPNVNNVTAISCQDLIGEENLSSYLEVASETPAMGTIIL
jgi:hypothetical protein